jgi:hypothetical protein
MAEAESDEAEIARRQLEETAYHEAGHTVMAFELGRKVRYITTIPGLVADTRGHVRPTASPKWHLMDDSCAPRMLRWIEREIAILISGPLAQGMFLGEFDSVGASRDHQEVIRLGSMLFNSPDAMKEYLEKQVHIIVEFLKQPSVWVQVEALAAALIVRRTIGGKRARQICREALANLDDIEDEAERHEDTRDC